MAQIGQAVQEAGTAVQDFMDIGTDQQSAAAYREAAADEAKNVDYATESGLITGTQIQRQAQESLGTQTADEGANGFTQGGSSFNMLIASNQQSSLALGLNNEQTAINVNNFQIQENAYNQEANAAEAAARGALIGGVFAAVSSVASLASN